jgi:hypothetical protein
MFLVLQSMSPASGTGMSPSYPHSEPSSDYTMLIGSRAVQRPPSSSPPLTPNSQRVTSHIGEWRMARLITTVAKFHFFSTSQKTHHKH